VCISQLHAFHSTFHTVPSNASNALITFQPEREGTLYVGTSVSLVCTAVVTVDKSVVDTDVTVEFAFDNLPLNTSRVTTSNRIGDNKTMTFQAIAEFVYLLPSDGGVAFSCSSALLSPFVDPTTYPTITLVLDNIAGELHYQYVGASHHNPSYSPL
jgi:hypothetical protein